MNYHCDLDPRSFQCFGIFYGKKGRLMRSSVDFNWCLFLSCCSPVFVVLCALDGPRAPCRRLRSLPRDFPDRGDGRREPGDVAAPLSRHRPHLRRHGDHVHHRRCVCVLCKGHVCVDITAAWAWIWTSTGEDLSDASLFSFFFFQFPKAPHMVRSLFVFFNVINTSKHTARVKKYQSISVLCWYLKYVRHDLVGWLWNKVKLSRIYTLIYLKYTEMFNSILQIYYQTIVLSANI